MRKGTAHAHHRAQVNEEIFQPTRAGKTAVNEQTVQPQRVTKAEGRDRDEKNDSSNRSGAEGQITPNQGDQRRAP
jgi:hypothetical protein